MSSVSLVIVVLGFFCAFGRVAVREIFRAPSSRCLVVV